MSSPEQLPEKSLAEKATDSLPEGYWYHPAGYLWHVLPVEKFRALPDTVEVQGDKLFKKSEFHVTVVNVPFIAQTIQKDEMLLPDAIAKVLDIFQTYLKEHPISFKEFTGDLRLAKSEERESIAARCILDNLEGYFEQIRAETGVDVPVQPAHVSIYSREKDAAVGIDTAVEMESFAQIDLPEISAILAT
jgi:hypothetical protein